MMDLALLVKALKSHRYSYQNEKELQEGVEQVLKGLGVPFEREKQLPGDAGIIDFLVGGWAGGSVGIEIKTQGSPSEVARQLIRYCGCDLIRELILLTGRSRLGQLPKEMLGKKLTVVTLWETFL